MFNLNNTVFVNILTDKTLYSYRIKKIMKILHIDDSPEICQLYKDFLGIQNHSVDTAYDGQKGLKLAIKNEYDVILLDITMPQYSGMDFLQDLKEKKPSEINKVTIVSQFEFDEKNIEKLKELGVNSIQAKTIDLIKYEKTGELEMKNNLVYS